MKTVNGELVLRGRKIRVDEDGFVCLNDIQRAAGFSTNRRPAEWRGLSTTHELIMATYKRVVPDSAKGKIRISAVLRSGGGEQGGIWAHPILAAAYAGYLKPELEVEMRELWLRYRSGDATLADEILQRASDEDNEWAATRAMSRAKRTEYTKTLSEHGVEGYGYGTCTNSVYEELLDASAKKLREIRALPKSGNLRDAMSRDELVYVMMAETLSKGRIVEEDSRGNGQCATATRRASGFVRQAIEMEKNDRQRPLDV
jgi:hypothetical protein